LDVFFDVAAAFDCAPFDGAGFDDAGVCFDGAGVCLWDGAASAAGVPRIIKARASSETASRLCVSARHN
jgi:hypothetical protein